MPSNLLCFERIEDCDWNKNGRLWEEATLSALRYLSRKW